MRYEVFMIEKEIRILEIDKEQFQVKSGGENRVKCTKQGLVEGRK